MESVKQPTLSDLTQEKPIKSTRSQAIHRSIGLFIAKDLRRYSVAEKSGFINLVNTLEPKYNIPSRSFFSDTVIPGIYEEVKHNLVMGYHSCHGLVNY